MRPHRTDVHRGAGPAAPSTAPVTPGRTGKTGKPGKPEPLGRELLTVALVVVLGMAMSGLDMTAVNVSLNRLSTEYSTSLATVQWVATAYTLSLAAVIPVTAWAIGRFGTRRVYMTSVGLFLGGSLLCGAAWSIESLIAFRVLQGFGGGMLMPVGLTILTRRGGSRIPQVMAIVGIPMQLAPMAGPLVGGWLVDSASWRWIFYLNLPLGLVALFLAARVLGPDEPEPARPLDVAGLLLLSPGLSALVFGLTTGAHRGDFGTAGAAVPTALGAVLVAAFGRHALRTAHPLIDLRLLGQRAVGASAAALALFVAGFFGMMLLVPMYFQMVRGESATATGLLLIPQGLGTLVVTPVVARLITGVGPRRMLATGLATTAAGLTVFAVLVGSDAPYPLLCSALFVAGGGIGMTMMPTMSSAVQSVPSGQVPAVSTLLNIVQQTGASAGTALMSLVLSGALEGRGPAHAPEAFQISYAVGIGLLALALIPASRIARKMILRGDAGAADADPDADAGGGPAPATGKAAVAT